MNAALSRFLAFSLILSLSLPNSAFDRGSREPATGNGAASFSRSHALRVQNGGLEERTKTVLQLEAALRKDNPLIPPIVAGGLEEPKIGVFLPAGQIASWMARNLERFAAGADPLQLEIVYPTNKAGNTQREIAPGTSADDLQAEIESVLRTLGILDDAGKEWFVAITIQMASGPTGGIVRGFRYEFLDPNQDLKKSVTVSTVLPKPILRMIRNLAKSVTPISYDQPILDQWSAQEIAGRVVELLKDAERHRDSSELLRPILVDFLTGNLDLLDASHRLEKEGVDPRNAAAILALTQFLAEDQSDSAAGLEEGELAIGRNRLKTAGRVAVADQARAYLRDLGQLGVTIQVLDPEMLEQYPELAPLAALTELSDSILIDRGEVTLEYLHTRGTRWVDYYGLPINVARFDQKAEGMTVIPHEPGDESFIQFLTELLHAMAPLKLATQTEVERLAAQLLQLAA